MLDRACDICRARKIYDTCKDLPAFEGITTSEREGHAKALQGNLSTKMESFIMRASKMVKCGFPDTLFQHYTKSVTPMRDLEGLVFPKLSQSHHDKLWMSIPKHTDAARVIWLWNEMVTSNDKVVIDVNTLLQRSEDKNAYADVSHS